ncbi:MULTISPECIES: hypothetical protein [unclassified Xanthomonas]|uniref:hypothetical protein n=1 Tax=unclassified Xanthomonas TaxID=2643310 RepID=UPI0018F766ED|nr:MULTISPECIES: hypothetical protein [unclassified Xanthomonas]
MTTLKNRKTASPPGVVLANNRLTQQEHFSFGVTIEQIDRFHTLLRTITAQSDMVAVCSGQALDNGSVSILGESIFNAARALRGIVDEIDAQPLCGEHQRLR